MPAPRRKIRSEKISLPSDKVAPLSMNYALDGVVFALSDWIFEFFGSVFVVHSRFTRVVLKRQSEVFFRVGVFKNNIKKII